MPELNGPAIARDRLLTLVRETTTSRPPLTDAYRRFVGFESEAARISLYQPMVVPGLLQTADYAVAVTAAILPGAPDDADVVARSRIRRERQHLVRERVAAGEDLHIVAVLEDAVLRRPIGGAAVLGAQLEHLVEQAALPHVTLIVMPTDLTGHVGLGGIFDLLEVAGENPDLLFIEAAASDYLHDDPRLTALYRDKVDALRRGGLTGADAVAHIQQVRDSLRLD
jgi:Domain of unknown function (DUF5753)